MLLMFDIHFLLLLLLTILNVQICFSLPFFFHLFRFSIIAHYYFQHLPQRPHSFTLSFSFIYFRYPSITFLTLLSPHYRSYSCFLLCISSPFFPFILLLLFVFFSRFHLYPSHSLYLFYFTFSWLPLIHRIIYFPTIFPMFA